MRIAVAVLAVTGAVLSGCTSGPPPPEENRSYEQQIAQQRADKDASFKRSNDSPIPADARAAFTGLAYFPVDAAFRVPAALQEDRGGPPSFFELDTSQHQRRRTERVGLLSFTLGETTFKLSAFADEGKPLFRLFVPFRDATSGTETYGGGRYLELERTMTGLYDLDFNQAYHPYCLYNVSYDCPVPPRENRLAVAIRAGEKMKGS